MSLIKRLIDDYSNRNLVLFLRRKIPGFRPEEEDLGYLFDDERYSKYLDIKKLGEAEIDHDDLIVLSAKTKEILTERSGKKKQYEIAKKILKEENKDSAVFVFYDEEGNFRFSFIRANYTGRKRDFTDFKRYTYYVSPQLTNKTFIKQIEACDFSSLDAIIEAFSIKKVTKEFYENLQNWYFRAIENTTFPKEVEQSAEKKKEAIIRLITRLMFIWFMREKKLVPDELFDRQKLSELIEDFGYANNYYPAVLQNLFFATLSVPMKERRFRKTETYQGKNKDYGNQYVYRYHSFMLQPEVLKELFFLIPFLNGGLFECLDYRDAGGQRHFIDGFTETNNPQNRPDITDTLFFNNEETGIIDIFKTYNFTVDENDPNDIEVALDPELLGNVFENLLAVFNPETADIARNATGSFYTPRKIVDYMVTESLYEYFTRHIHDKTSFPKIRALLQGRIQEDKPLFDTATRKKMVELINQLRIVDPAVGSGAFPMTILNKLVSLLEKLDPENNLWKEEQYKVVEQIPDAGLRKKLFDEIDKQFARKNADFGRKLYLIQQVIYGVDIQNTAIEIAKLRFFISLLVEEKLNPGEDNLGLMPLPNLDFKLMQGDSLRETCCGIQFSFEVPGETAGYGDLFNEAGVENILIKRFKKLKEKFAVEPNPHTKKKYKNEINKILIELIINKVNDYENALLNLRGKDKNFFNKVNKYFPVLNEYLPDKKIPSEKELKEAFKKIKRKIEFELKEMLAERKAKEFFLWDIFFAEVFNEKDGFDIVIGNPPYIQLNKTIPGKNIHYADLYKDEGYETFERTGDIYALFYECGLDITRDKGILTYITSKTWMRTKFGKSLRQFLSKYNPKILIDLGPGVFSNATVDTNIMLVEKTPVPQHYLRAITLTDKEKLHHLEDKDFTILTDLGEESWNILSHEQQQIKEKIERIGTPLKDWDINIYRGILTGYNEAFIINGNLKDTLIAQDPKSAEILKPLLRGRDIKRYKAKFADKWIIATFPAKKININTYPAVKRFLEGFRPKIDQTGKYLTEIEKKKIIKHAETYGIQLKYNDLKKSRKKTGNKWFETQDQIAYFNNFENNKMIFTKASKEQSFAFDTNKFYLLQTAYLATGNNLKFIIGLLNSTFVNYSFIQFFQSGGIMGEITYQAIINVPIPKIPPSQQVPFEKLVDQIIAGKEKGEDTTALERQIDLMVYKLYELTYDEVKIVDPAFEMEEEEYEKYRLINV